jgi:hypothetical protein
MSDSCRARIQLIAVACLALSACGGAEPTSSDLWCAGLCAAVRRCGYNDPNCQGDCVSQRPGLASESTSAAAAQEPCLAGLSCQALSGDQMAWMTETDACWQQAAASVEITTHVRQFCASHALVWFDCGYTLSLDDCAHLYGRWNDTVLDRLAACEAQTICDDFVSCENDVFNNL